MKSWLKIFASKSDVPPPLVWASVLWCSAPSLDTYSGTRRHLGRADAAQEKLCGFPNFELRLAVAIGWMTLGPQCGGRIMMVK